MSITEAKKLIWPPDRRKVPVLRHFTGRKKILTKFSVYGIILKEHRLLV